MRFGIIGAGMIANIHADALRRCESTQLVGVMDNGSGKGKKIAPECDTTGADDLKTFIHRHDLDAITIASPSGAHLEAGLLAAQAGKHCLAEKPLEITVERCRALIDAHESAGTTLGGIFNTRYTAGAKMLKAAVEAGRFGKLTFASAIGPWWRDQGYYDSSSWKGTWALDGGGALMNQGIHSIDLLQWIVGERITAVNGRIATLAHERIEVEDTGSAHLLFESGALGTIACTTSMWPGHFKTITISGTHGTAVLADGNLLVWQFKEETRADHELRKLLLKLPGQGVGASDPSAGVDSDGHLAVIEEFVSAIDAGQCPTVDGVEAMKAVAIIRAVYASSHNNGKTVQPKY